MIERYADERVLASDAERQLVITRLHEACGEGRLTLEEFSERVSEVLAARTRGQLAPITADLPTSPRRFPAPPREPRNLTVSLFSDVKRRGSWRVSGEHRAISVFGACTLDLRNAILSGDEVTIDTFVLFGALKVIVPPGTAVEMEGFAVFGSRESKVEDDPAVARTPLVRVHGLTAFGAVEVVAQ